MKKLKVFQITLEIDFLKILERCWLQVDVQNGAKIDIKGCWKNAKKMMMARMALRSQMGESEWDRNLDFRAWGGRYSLRGGVNPSSCHGGPCRHPGWLTELSKSIQFLINFPTPLFFDFGSILAPNLASKSFQNPLKIDPKSDLENYHHFS